MSMPIGTQANTWPPLPPQPPDPPRPRHTPWLPDARPPDPVSASASLVVGAPDWLAQRLLDQRVIALAGELDPETVDRTVAELGLLDASGDAPVSLRLSGVSADLDSALTLIDALDLMGAPVHATCLGTLAAACRRPVDDIAADMRVGRLLSAHEAQGYGLVDTTEPPGRQQVP
jgi:ATP-dependent Clp protease protease subunit